MASEFVLLTILLRSNEAGFGVGEEVEISFLVSVPDPILALSDNAVESVFCLPNPVRLVNGTGAPLEEEDEEILDLLRIFFQALFRSSFSTT